MAKRQFPNGFNIKTNINKGDKVLLSEAGNDIPYVASVDAITKDKVDKVTGKSLVDDPLIVKLSDDYSRAQVDVEVNKKVDKATGKSLIDDTLITKLNALPSNTALTTSLGSKVDKVTGKSLISDIALDKLNALPDNTALTTSLGSKVDIVAGKSLVNDNDILKINQLPTRVQLDTSLTTKVDKVVGKSLSTNDFTNDLKNKIDVIKTTGNDNKYLNEVGEYKEVIAGIQNITVNGSIVPAENGVVGIIIPDANISSKEEVIGTYSLDGNNLQLFSTTFKLNSLPKIKDEEKEYVLKDEPLGYGIFLNIQKTSVTSGRSLIAEYYNENYKISKVYVDNDLKTKVKIKCIEDAFSTKDITMTLTLEYLKYDGNVVEFSLELPDGVNADDVTLTFPKLKFNKKFAFSYISDDSCSIYQFIFSGINKRYVATTMNYFYHLNQPISPDFTVGFTPEYPLEFTDGTGNKRRFTTSVAVWPDKLVDKGAVNNNVGRNWPWMSSKEYQYYKDFGYSILYHDLNNYDASSVTQENFNQWFSDTKAQFLEYIGESPKILAEPNGDHRYLTLSQTIDDLMMNTAQSGHPLIKKAFPYKNDFTLDKTQIAVERYFSGATDYAEKVYNFLKGYNDTSDLNTVQWLIGSGHRSSLWEYDLFKKINDDFGAIGNDKIWFTTVDEFFEYWFLTKNSTVLKSVEGNTIKFKIYAPSMPRFWFNEVSCLISGIASTSGLNLSSNTDGLSYGINDNKLLVNLNYNDNLISKAEKFTSAFEKTPNSDYVYDDAMYIVSQLKPSLRQPFLNRLNHLTSPPLFTKMTLNNGIIFSESRDINVELEYKNTVPTHYMISENPQFIGAVWYEYNGDVNYQLSSDYEQKTLYAKLKNTFGDSNTVTANIELRKPELRLVTLTVEPKISVKVAEIKLTFTGFPTQYRLSTTNDFTGIAWEPLIGDIVNYNIPDPFGLKVLFIQLYDSVEQKSSNMLSTSFEYVDPLSAILDSIIINDGAEETASGTVIVKLNVVNTITHYRLANSINDLSNAIYIPFINDIVSYNSGLTNGNLTVFVQVKNTLSESQIKSSSIIVKLPVTATQLSINKGATTFEGLIAPVEFIVGQGTPTQYRLSESSSGINTSPWLDWTTDITFTFTTVGTKTLYGQIRNNVSMSSVVSDQIKIIEPPLAVVVGFNNTVNNTNSKVITSGVTTNQINLALFAGYAPQQLVDNKGQVVAGWFMNLQTEFYATNSVFSGSFTGLPPNSKAIEPSGIYSLASMAKMYTANQPGAENLGRKARVSFTLPTGTFRIRVLWNTGSDSYSLANDASRLQCFYGIFQGTTELARTLCSNTAGFTGLHNQAFNAEMEFTVDDASIPIDFGAWALSAYNRPGFNLIEISKIG
nr:hypothetical protein [uncultured Sphingobacterium sp.]